MQIEPTALPDVLILTPRRFGDARGWFMETWNAARMAVRGGTRWSSKALASGK
jgi:dTDP-4-dehydrorhamnose 3,5-epimerase